MRRRLIVSFVALVVATILLFGVPRAFVVADFVTSTNREQVDRGADSAATVARLAMQGGEEVTPDLLGPLLADGERLEFRSGDGDSFVVPADTGRGADDLVTTRSLDGGASITYSLSGSDTDAEVVDALTPLLLLALGLIILGVLAGAVLARRLARPFAELAETAREMGTGQLEPDVPHYAVHEADEIASALRESSRQLRDMLERERDVAVNASHELRTPITALRLTLEDIALWPETTPEVRAELDRLVAEVDRLADAVTTMLDARRRWSAPSPG
jgi:signal transduction histidine kinase